MNEQTINRPPFRAGFMEMIIDPILFAPITRETPTRTSTQSSEESEEAATTPFLDYLTKTAPMWASPMWEVTQGKDITVTFDYTVYNGSSAHSHTSMSLRLGDSMTVKTVNLPDNTDSNPQNKCSTLAKQVDGGIRHIFRINTRTLPCWSTMKMMAKLTFSKPVSAVVFIERADLQTVKGYFVLEDGTKVAINDVQALADTDKVVIFDENKRLQGIEYEVGGTCPNGGAYTLFRIYPYEAKDVEPASVPTVTPISVSEYLSKASPLSTLGLYSEDGGVWLDKKTYVTNVLDVLKKGETYVLSQYAYLDGVTATLSQLIFTEDDVVFSVHAHRKSTNANTHKGAFVRFVLPALAYVNIRSTPVDGASFWYQMIPVADLSIIESPTMCYCRSPSVPTLRTPLANLGTLMNTQHDIGSTIFEGLNLNNLGAMFGGAMRIRFLDVNFKS